MPSREQLVDERPLEPSAVREVYRQRAAHYDITSRLYGLLGFRLERYRREALQKLQLRPGDAVVELGCGTGANLRALQQQVGSGGRIIGVGFLEAIVVLLRPFGVTLGLAERKPWLSIERHMALDSMEDRYLGTTYIAVGVAPASGGNRSD